MEVNKKNVFDVSSFFFFEATGDSDEADTFNDPNVAAAIDHRRPDHHDDAESSCSCDLSDDFPLVVTDHRHDVNGSDSRSCTTVDDEEEEGEEAHSYTRWSCVQKKNNNKKKKKNGAERDKKSSISVDSSKEIKSEKEKNRLFWETCLAS